MSLEVKNATELSKSSKNESKIASLVIGLNVSSQDSDTKSDGIATHSLFMSNLIKNVGPNFIISMLKSSVKLREIALNSIYFARHDSFVVEKITDQGDLLLTILYDTQSDLLLSRTAELINVVFTASSVAQLSQLMKRLLQLSSHSKSVRASVTLGMLSYGCFCAYSSSLHSSSTYRPRELVLTPEEACTLRSLIVQGLHGALPTSERNDVYRCLRDLLSSTSLIALQWTLESIPPETGTNTSTSPALAGQFASVMSALLLGEVHLYFEEFCDIYPPLMALPLSRFSSGHSSRSSGSSDSVSGAIDESILHRYKLVCDMLPVLFTLSENVLELLLNPLSVAATAAAEDAEGLWASLPSSVLIKIHNSMHACVAEIFDFIQWACEQRRAISQETVSSPVVQSLRHLVTRSWGVACAFSAEDSSCHSLFIAHAQHALVFSCTFPHTIDSQAQQTLWDTLLSGQDDVLFRLLPCMLQVYDQIASDRVADNDTTSALQPSTRKPVQSHSQQFVDYSNSEDEKESEGADEEESESSTLLEALLSVSQLVNLAALVIVSILSRLDSVLATGRRAGARTEAGDSHSYFAVARVLESGCDVLRLVLVHKRSDLEVLIPVEGVDAMSSVCGYRVSSSFSDLRGLLKDRTRLHSALGSHVSEAELNAVLASCSDLEEELKELGL